PSIRQRTSQGTLLFSFTDTHGWVQLTGGYTVVSHSLTVSLLIEGVKGHVPLPLVFPPLPDMYQVPMHCHAGGQS
ncbi:MAG: hypothetical protein ACKPKO_34375, partial [Candidatus Fonsibacter sp.]